MPRVLVKPIALLNIGFASKGKSLRIVSTQSNAQKQKFSIKKLLLSWLTAGVRKIIPSTENRMIIVEKKSVFPRMYLIFCPPAQSNRKEVEASLVVSVNENNC